jgi:hypothetical protein
MQLRSIGTEGGDPAEKNGESAIKRRWRAVCAFWVFLSVGLAAFVTVASAVGSNASSTESDLGSHATYGLLMVILMDLLLMARVRSVRSKVSADVDALTGRLLHLVLADPVPPSRARRPTPSSWLSLIWIGILCEAIAVAGFVFFLIGGFYPWLYIAVAIAAMALIYFRPRRQDFTAAAARHEAAPQQLRGKDLAWGTALALGVILVLAALGMAFILLAIGLMYCIGILLLFVKDRQSALRLFEPPYHRHIWLVVKVVVFVGFGLYLLIEGGFCKQNFICMFLR